MTTTIQIRLSISDSSIQFLEWTHSEPIMLGRQQPGEVLFQLNDKSGTLRLPVAHENQVAVSRTQVLLSREGENVVIENLKPGISVEVDDAPLPAGPDSKMTCQPSFVLSIGNCRLDFQVSYQTLTFHTQIYDDLSSKPTPDFKEPKSSSDYGAQIAYLGQITSVLHRSTSESELYKLACESIKDLIRVDGVVLQKTTNSSEMHGDENIDPPQKVLKQVLDERRVCWGTIPAETLDSPRIFYVASPVPDHRGEVVAVLYAQREVKSNQTNVPFDELNAVIVELIAVSVAAANDRIQNHRMISQFEQFFTPELAKKLTRGEGQLIASESDITVLIGDIRGFSGISERLKPSDTSEWVQDVLDQLSNIVLAHDGVLVDYIGDEIIAMWGAPEKQPKHAEMACRCASEMISKIPKISKKWEAKIGAATTVGIGINSGVAFVGNTGSKIKFKYGPLGDTVNRASRVQGLTKHLKVDALITSQTYQKLPVDLPTRRIGRARVVNINDPIEIFQLLGADTCESQNQSVFEDALTKLEQGEISAAAELINQNLDFENPDHPTLMMLDELIRRTISGEASGAYERTFDTK